MALIDIEVISPAGVVFKGSAYLVNIPAIDGEMAFAPDCESVVTIIDKGDIKIFDQSIQLIEKILVKGGTAKISNNKLDLLIDI